MSRWSRTVAPIARSTLPRGWRSQERQEIRGFASAQRDAPSACPDAGASGAGEAWRSKHGVGHRGPEPVAQLTQLGSMEARRPLPRATLFSR